jgi:hypothetical protein
MGRKKEGKKCGMLLMISVPVVIFAIGYLCFFPSDDLYNTNGIVSNSSMYVDHYDVKWDFETENSYLCSYYMRVNDIELNQTISEYRTGRSIPLRLTGRDSCYPVDSFHNGVVSGKLSNVTIHESYRITIIFSIESGECIHTENIEKQLGLRALKIFENGARFRLRMIDEENCFPYLSFVTVEALREKGSHLWW